MPYKDPEKQKEYQRELMRKRRESNKKSNETVRPTVRPETDRRKVKPVKVPGIQPGILYRKKHDDLTLVAFDSKHGKWRPVRSLQRQTPIPELGNLQIIIAEELPDEKR